MVYNSKKLFAEADRYKMQNDIDILTTMDFYSTETQEILISTANLIIIKLIVAFRNEFINSFEFEHAIDKIITYIVYSNLMPLQNVFYKLYSEVAEPYLHINYKFIGVVTFE